MSRFCVRLLRTQHTLTYDDENHLTGYDAVSMVCRPDGLRASKNGGTTHYFYSGGKLLYEFDGVSRKIYAWGASGLEQINSTDPDVGLRYPFYDPQGNVSGDVSTGWAELWMTGVSGACAITNSGLADPRYLIQAGANGTWGVQFGAHADTDLGDLVLLSQRYYSPSTGRFITRDPIGYE